MKKYNFKQLQFLFLCFFGLSTLLMSSCSGSSSDPAPGPESQLAGKEWQTDGVYVNNTKTISPNVRMMFANNALKTLNVNGSPLATWALSSDGQTLTISYPTFNISSLAFEGLQSKTFTVSKLTDDELWFRVSGTEEVSLFGLITLDSNSEYRMNLTGTNNTVTSGELTGATWTGNNDTENTGIFTRPSSSEDFTWNRNTGLTLKFGTTLGFNHVAINGIPAPGSWELNEDRTKLTISYPSFTKSDNTEEKGGTVVFDIVRETYGYKPVMRLL